MADIDRTKMEKWVFTWKKAALSLEEVRKNELRAPDYYEKNREIINEMLQYACENGEVRLSSGLVEMQRIFMKQRQKNLPGN